MARVERTPRRTTAEPRAQCSGTLTIRLTQEDRDLLRAMVEQQAAEMADAGVEVTAASYVRGLTRQEAREEPARVARRLGLRRAATR